MAIDFYDLSGLGGRRFSPFGWRARLALAHKGLESGARVEHVRFSDKHKLAFSGQELVPVIVDGGTVVSDSWQIARYLEGAYPGEPPLFGGPGGEAGARFVAAWTDSRVHPLVARCVVRDILDAIEPEDRAYFRASREKRFGAKLEETVANREETRGELKMALYPLRKAVEGGGFLGGAGPNFADYAAFGAFMWARVVSPFRLLEEDDPVYAWRERMLDLHGGLPRAEPGFPV